MDIVRIWVPMCQHWNTMATNSKYKQDQPNSIFWILIYLHLHFISIKRKYTDVVSHYLSMIGYIPGGVTDVLVAKCDNVSTWVLVNWSALLGLIMSAIYCIVSWAHLSSPPMISIQDVLASAGLAVSGSVLNMVPMCVSRLFLKLTQFKAGYTRMYK